MTHDAIAFMTMPEHIAGPIHTLGVFLGPYRNLTTLTASILYLHPACQVLNHAGDRVFGDQEVNFLLDPSAATFARFCAFALSASEGGRRGAYGGSIRLSHAFDDDVIRDAARKRFGEHPAKASVDSIVWKESLRVSMFLREQRIDIGALLAANDKLRFLMPIRNPLDCATSNIRTGLARLWHGSSGGDIKDILERILTELAWFRDLTRRHGTDHFLSFFEFEFDEALLRRLAAFLQLSPDPAWIEDALHCYRLKGGYEHDPALLEWYKRRVRQVFADDETFARKLESFSR
ncbi:hypothetical protein [Sorangium sp. So ce1389]|uniref:hypothetical protein n=1 Tax=Sorangium sp. So ce1389 TaxID=3133336 RepID=UPI003F645ECC